MSAPYFIHLTDLHLAPNASWQALETFVQQVRQMHPPPAFVVNGGDIVAGHMQIPSDPEDLRADFQQYQRIMADLPVPIYNVVGNHDTARSEGPMAAIGWGKQLFEEYCGPRYQSFDWHGWHVVALDEWRWRADGTECFVDGEQMLWLRNDLATCGPGQTVLFLVHRRLRDQQVTSDQINAILRDDLTYVELAGCDHQSSFWPATNWSSYTTGSFCGAWWAGPGLDLGQPGYALVFPDGPDRLRRYYRPIDRPLAVALPHCGQVVGRDVHVDAIDPQTGHRATYTTELPDTPAGWQDLTVRVDDACQTIPIFREPTEQAVYRSTLGAVFECELVEAIDSSMTVTCNGQPVGQCNLAGEACQVPIKGGVRTDWVRITLTGQATIRHPRLVVAGRVLRDPRVERLETIRPEWLGDARPIVWNLARKGPTTAFVRPENTFYFHCERYHCHGVADDIS